MVALKNYVAKDQEGMFKVGENQEKTHLQLMYHFIKRCLEVNRNSSGGYLDGVSIMGLIIALFENMTGMLDSELPQIFAFIADELSFIAT